MKCKLLSCIAALAVCVSTVAGAEYYAGLGYGASWNGGHAWRDGRKYDMETFSGLLSVFGGMVLPTEWTDFRLEGEYLQAGIESDDNTTHRFKSVMANATAIIPNVDFWAKPYAGLGIGYARWDHQNSAALQFIGGLEYEFEEQPIALDLEYRHLWLNENGGKGYNTTRWNSDAVMLKGKFLF